MRGSHEVQGSSQVGGGMVGGAEEVAVGLGDDHDVGQLHDSPLDPLEVVSAAGGGQQHEEVDQVGHGQFQYAAIRQELSRREKGMARAGAVARRVEAAEALADLVPGDVIVCGTPTGAGARFDPPIWLKPGDVVEVEAEGIGLLRNTIADEVL